jgi:hypothetical protein
MITQLATIRKWLPRPSRWQADPSPPAPPAIPLERPNLSRLAQPDAELPLFVRESRPAMKALALLGPLDWDHFPERDPHRPWPGPQPLPRAPFVAAFLLKLDHNLRYMSDLREYLVDTPPVLWVLGFPLAPSDAFSWGFDADKSLPTARHFGRVLRTLPNEALQFLLTGLVRQIREELPPDAGFGQVISCDTKHIIAWVKENNPKAYVEDRYDKTKQPKADPDCRLGCKRRHNKKGTSEGEAASEAAASPSTASTPAPSSAPRPEGAPATPTTHPIPAKDARVGEFYWGYGSGVIATKVPGWGEFLLAEFTQTFDHADISYFFPLMERAEHNLGFRPKFAAFDAAFDAFYVYDYFHQEGKDWTAGFAAVPFSERGGYKDRQFSPDGLPLCRAGLVMPLKLTFTDRSGLVEHQCARYACPLLFPQPTGQTCPVADKHWATGGCVACFPTSIGARLRYQIDRDSNLYKQVYKQRTVDERINSQAKELGIETPRLRNGQAITNQNTLIYLLGELRALHRLREKKQALNRQEANLPPNR